jgi:hypothetical protein
MNKVGADLAPEAHTVENAEVVIVAMAPVGGVQIWMRSVEDGFHAALRNGIRRAAENEAVVKENRADLRHLN